MGVSSEDNTGLNGNHGRMRILSIAKGSAAMSVNPVARNVVMFESPMLLPLPYKGFRPLKLGQAQRG